MSKMRPLVIGNWKMNLDFVEAVHLCQQLGVVLKNRPLENTDLVVAPPFVDLRSVSSVFEADRIPISISAQHVNFHDNGAHTGEVSVSMLKRLGVRWVLVGHSERRAMYAMDDETVVRTLQAVVRAELHAVVCVGEALEVREANDHAAFVRAQLESALAGLESRHHELVTIAYEPVWAIGTGLTASVEQVREMMTTIRRVLSERSLEGTRVLYGGSVNAENAQQLVEEGAVDGFLVGGASLKAESFLAIAQTCDDCYAGRR